MIKKAVYVLIIIHLLSPYIFSQNKEEKSGVVSFVSGDIIYFNLNETEGIKTGDTIFTTDKRPIAKVISFASKSISGTYIFPEHILDINDKVLIYIEKSTNEQITEQPTKKIIKNDLTDSPQERKTNIRSKVNDIYGRFSIQSYSSLNNSNLMSDIQRWRYSFSLKADNIVDKLSFSNYIIFSYRADDWSAVKDNFGRALKVYDFYLNYKPVSDLQFWLGRNINRKISNIGSIDGLQGEYIFSEFFTGLIVGFRPNFTDMGFNSKLLQYGGYLGRTDTINNSIMENTAAIIQQTYNSKVDRRFFYFQHNNNIIKNIFVFASVEADLYERNRQEEKTTFSLTGTYLMIRYNPLKDLSFSASYDARKNVIYYETFKNYLDSLFENEIRQGLNFNSNLRIFDNLFLSLNYGYRYKKGDIKPSRNYGGSFSYSNIPYVESYAILSYNKIISNYLSGDLIGFRISKTLEFIGSELAIYLRNTNYNFLRSSSVQNSLGADFNTKISKNFYFSFGYEGIYEKQVTSGKIIINLNTRF
ncbi:MAG: hypothetical protein ACM3O3_05585 [Syntrophothermus sp.]